MATRTALQPTTLAMQDNPPGDSAGDARRIRHAVDHQAGVTPATGALLLQVWLSPSFPVGSFAYSHGLEWAVEARDIDDRPTLEAWLTDLVEVGSLRNDLIFLSCAWRAIAAPGPTHELAPIAELSAAMFSSAERRLESLTQGGSFVTAIQAAAPCRAMDHLLAIAEGAISYPVAVGVASAGHGIALNATLEAYGVAFVANLTSAAIRLSVIGQSDAQRVIARLLPLVQSVADSVAAATLEDLGTATFKADLASHHHETQYTRLFRS
jgi:urease accessory protein